METDKTNRSSGADYVFVSSVEREKNRRERLARLYDQHVHAVFRYAWRLTGRRDLAEDFTSEAFLALHRNLDQVEDARLPAWLFTEVRNLAIEYWRRASREQTLSEAAPFLRPDGSSSLVDLLSRATGLKPVHRICLTLRYLYGMDRQEIARQTGLSEHQIKSALQYGLELLRRELTS
ncbi:MAG: sigma-70 family RNA polymerase sigma factor [Bryobacteraceae bacterium]|nr:sigma-70 family RNA polymerase sigma factor [Bryobacteraceae bacterium]MDW8376810.1 sigma-70 family RNA polymerase sigma factor [Bryobacterales bacterium]